ncbi:MAG: ATP-binding cassette domain-containing protein, partial [Saprospiraceae bacterium]|nr:ATP-binding cassette domain-containing protein [Saprospiraceae bacterium]
MMATQQSPPQLIDSSPSGTMLKMEDLTKIYPTPGGNYVVLENLQLEIKSEEFVSIIGHSGCGKTTLLTMIAGLNNISSGRMLLKDSPITGPGPDRGVIFQSPCLLPWMTALQNVMVGVNQVYAHGNSKEREDIAKYYLSRVGLENAFEKKPSELSQGMQQRVGIA